MPYTPTCPVLDSFGRPDEAVASGWQKPIRPGEAAMSVVSGRLVPATFFASAILVGGIGVQGREQAYVTIAGGSPGSDSPSIFCCISNPGLASVNAYQAYVFAANSVRLYRIVNNAQTQVAASGVITVSTGDSLAIWRQGNTVTASLLHGGAWADVCSYTDPTPIPTGFVGLASDGTGTQFAAFGADLVPLTGAPETSTTWSPLMLDDVLDGGPSPSPEALRVGRYD